MKRLTVLLLSIYVGHSGVDATRRSEERGKIYNLLSMSYISKLLLYCIWDSFILLV